MRIEVKYGSLSEREVKVIEYQNQGLRMLSDTFDADWKRGTEPRGIMIFTDEPPIAVIDKPTKLEKLEARVKALEDKQ